MKKILDYLTPVVIFILMVEGVKALLHQGGVARISEHLGMLHELLQLSPDDTVVNWEDGSEGSVPDAISYYMDELIKELQT